MKIRMGTCVECKVSFPLPVRRGRPPVRCDGCRENGAQARSQRSAYVAEQRAAGQPVRRHTPSSGPGSVRSMSMQGITIKEALAQLPRMTPATRMTVEVLSPEQRVDRLTMLLMSRGTHISQNQQDY